MKSRTLIDKQMRRKTNSELVRTILAVKKANWIEVAGVLAGPTRNILSVNLDEIDKKAKEHEVVLVPGKVLGSGSLTKRIKVVALAFSKSAEEKLKKDRVEYSTIKQEVERNPKLKFTMFKK